ncbi:hypothetical protein HJFPF1_07002 [Paramyrothecium foliicola]|nr:hypothetical protein HJFPF1_07002 [Paramyrothecium foliicola]
MTWYPPSVTLPVYAVFTFVGIVLTCLRFWARKVYTRQPLGPDDWFMAAGMFVVCCCTGIQFYNGLEGTNGNAIKDGDAVSRQITSHKINFTMIIIEKPAFGAIKLSLLYFYKRIFGIWPSFNRLNNIIIVIIVLWTISFSMADIFICGTKIHLNFLVDQSQAKDQCGDKGMLLLMFAVTSVITDALVLGLPFQYVRRLQMARQKKWAAALVIFLGFVSTLAGVLRTIFLCVSYPMGRMDWGYKAPPHSETPLVLQVFNPTFWVMIEMMLGAWAANLPPLGPLLRHMSFRKSQKNVSEYGTYGSFSDGKRTYNGEYDEASLTADTAPMVHLQAMQNNGRDLDA